MARKDKVIPMEARAMDLVAAKKREQELTAEKALELYGDGQPYERLRYMEEVVSLLELTRRSIMEAGKRLLILRATEAHGGFIQSLEQIGIPYRTAARFMHIARRFGKYANLAHLNTSKLEALEDFTDPELQDLDDGKDVLGINLDDIDRMTASKLRENLRQAEGNLKKEKEARKADRATQEKAIAQKEAKITELDQLLRYQQPPAKEQLAIAELARLDGDYVKELATAMGAMRRAVTLLERAQCTPGVDGQILNDWVDNYNDQMQLLNGVHTELADTIDNLHPIDKGAYKED